MLACRGCSGKEAVKRRLSYKFLITVHLTLVLVSKSWYEGSNVPSFKSLVVDEERMKPGVSVVPSLHCFDIGGYVARRISDL